jgi:hypothetical protein
LHEHWFDGATATLDVGVGDTLYAYVYLDPANVPSELMLAWNNGTWEHRAYWGANLITYGTSGTASRRYMGPLPPAGQWARLEVPASQVGLEGSTLKGMDFAAYGGRATWDYAGKTSLASSPQPTPTTIRSSINLAAHGIQLTWASTPGKNYRVLSKENLAGASWTDLSGIIQAQGNSASWTDTTSNAANQRFYVVRAAD